MLLMLRYCFSTVQTFTMYCILRYFSYVDIFCHFAKMFPKCINKLTKKTELKSIKTLLVFSSIFSMKSYKKRRKTVMAAKIVENRYPTRLRHRILSSRIDFGSIWGSIWGPLFDHCGDMFRKIREIYADWLLLEVSGCSGIDF